MSEDLDQAIAQYRTELVADAVSPLDADELEDHLRALIAELRVAGRDADVAFAEAVRRLGQPRELAREYARVHPAFGAPLPRMRAWSAALLLVSVTVWQVWRTCVDDGSAIDDTGLLMEAGLMAALFARRTWSRAILLGAAAAAAINAAVTLMLWGFHPFWLCMLVPALGATVFLAPWRRGEITSAGWSLVAIGVAWGGVMSGATAPTSSAPLIDPLPWSGPLVLAVFALSLVGVLVRARWASLALVAAAICLVPIVRDLTALAHASGSTFDVNQVADVTASVIALIAAAVLAWPGARRGLGSVRWLAR